MISGVLINPPETDLLKGGWQGTEAQSTQGSAVGTGEETMVGKMGTKCHFAVRP